MRSHEPMSTTYERGGEIEKKSRPRIQAGGNISERCLFGGCGGAELWGGRARKLRERLTETRRGPHAGGYPARGAPTSDPAAYRTGAAMRASFRHRVPAADGSAADRAEGSRARRHRAGQPHHSSWKPPSSSLRVRGNGALAALIRPRSMRSARRRRVRTVAGGIPSTAPTSVASIPE